MASIQSCLRSWCARCARASCSTGKRDELVCKADRLGYPVKDGIPVMLEEEARKLPPEEEVRLEASTSSSRRATRRRRFPGKPLADLAGKPMVVRVCERAAKSGAAGVHVATDDERIADAVKAHGHQRVMTRADHPSGTDRLAEAARAAQAQGSTRSWSMCRATSR